MAETSSDDSSAPVEFQLSSSLDDNSKISYPVECPLCSKYRKLFYCKLCIRNGDFFNSSSIRAERFSEKRSRLNRLKEDRKQVQTLCEDKLVHRQKIYKVAGEIDSHKERIKLLKLLIQEKEKKVNDRKKRSMELHASNETLRQRLPKYRDRVRKLEELVRGSSSDAISQRRKLTQLQLDIKQRVRTNLQHLVEYIFPISVVQPQNRSQEDCDTVSALAEASRTAYMGGRWVYTDSSGELQHCIVAPTLPGSGDYSSYNSWVAANKDGGVPGSHSEIVNDNQAYNISAALTYTTQLINVLAFYLDVRLPSKLCYSEFCGSEVSEHKFARRVARLNWNVLHLCFSQRVDARHLQPTHTLHNLLLLLDTSFSDLGRMGAVEVDSAIACSLEDKLREQLEANTDDSSSEEDSDHLPNEWEAVPHTCLPEAGTGGGVAGAVGGGMVGLGGLSSQQQWGGGVGGGGQATSVAGGLVNSASARIASFWKGWTQHR
ncbi:beclin 1-associated autophagy-related key regulator [Nilaparvata lugens]|uniref:beclin 1-associated autophagy-related key regulator n=1 Tax=Nilaparvata lugens TaxID=108931 RepID=UPI00193C93E3|nr:beclin 1-associated autophagy-related key regulator [Nilaparvata lugens]